MDCRPNCGACCIAPSISSPLPGMPDGKGAGELCANLDPIEFTCRIWGTDQFPKVCNDFKPNVESCGKNKQEAMNSLNFFEKETDPTR